jgi:hypothetical protein
MYKNSYFVQNFYKRQKMYYFAKEKCNTDIVLLVMVHCKNVNNGEIILIISHKILIGLTIFKI